MFAYHFTSFSSTTITSTAAVVDVPSCPASLSSSSSSSQIRPSFLFIVCRCFNFITAIVAHLCVLVNVLCAAHSFKNDTDILDGIFWFYTVVISLFLAVAEAEWGFIIKF